MPRADGLGLGRRLDYLPTPVAIAVGGGLGVALGMVTAGLSPWLGGPLFVALGGLSLWLAGRGRTVVVLDEPEAKRR